MALTLDGTAVMPNWGFGGYGNNGYNGNNDGLGGTMGGVVGGLLAGSLFNRGGFGGGYGGYGGGYGAGPVATAATGAVADSIVLNPAFESLQNQISGIGEQVRLNGLNASISDVERTVVNTSTGVSNAIGDLSTAQAAQNFTTLTSINDLGRDVQATQNQAALQQLNSFNNLTTTTLQGFNNLQFQNAQGVNQIIAQGTASAAAVASGFCTIAREMAECCCEIKQKISDDGQATRALINDLNVQSLRDQLTAANVKVSNNDQNQYLLSTILAHIPVK